MPHLYGLYLIPRTSLSRLLSSWTSSCHKSQNKSNKTSPTENGQLSSDVYEWYVL